MGSMKCIIPGIHLKVFGRAIQSLSKIGDELYFEPLDEGLSLRTVNSSRSAYGCFQFAPSFFTTYITGHGKNSDESSSDNDGLRCKITMKSVMNVFRSLPTIDKTVEKCKIILNFQEDKLIFEMFCRHGIIKTHNLSFMDCETLQAIFSRDMCPNKVTAGPKLLCDAVLNFQAHQEEVTLMLRPDYVALKNYVEDEPNPTRVIHTELTLSPEEFDYFQVGVDTDITFCLKEFRAILSFADLTSLPMNLHIESPGRPVTFSITSDPSFEVNFVLATLADTEDGPPRHSQSQADGSRTNGKPHPSKSRSDTNSRKQISRRENSHPSSDSHDKSERNTTGDNGEDEDEDMDISDTTILENPHSKNRPTTTMQLPSQKRVHPTTTTSNTGLNKHTNNTHSNSNSIIGAEAKTADIIGNKQPSNKTNASSTEPEQLQRANSASAVTNTDKGFYVSPSEHSQSQQNIEIGRGGGGDGRDGSGFDNDDNEISQIIPIIRNETTTDNTNSFLFGAKNKGGKEEGEEEEEEHSDGEDNDDQICGTPPSKRFRSLFFSTQSSTQSTIASQSKPAVLCPDSDSDG